MFNFNFFLFKLKINEKKINFIYHENTLTCCHICTKCFTSFIYLYIDITSHSELPIMSNGAALLNLEYKNSEKWYYLNFSYQVSEFFLGAIKMILYYITFHSELLCQVELRCQIGNATDR